MYQRGVIILYCDKSALLSVPTYRELDESGKKKADLLLPLRHLGESRTNDKVANCPEMATSYSSKLIERDGDTTV